MFDFFINIRFLLLNSIRNLAIKKVFWREDFLFSAAVLYFSFAIAFVAKFISPLVYKEVVLLTNNSTLSTILALAGLFLLFVYFCLMGFLFFTEQGRAALMFMIQIRFLIFLAVFLIILYFTWITSLQDVIVQINCFHNSATEHFKEIVIQKGTIFLDPSDFSNIVLDGTPVLFVFLTISLSLAVYLRYQQFLHILAYMIFPFFLVLEGFLTWNALDVLLSGGILAKEVSSVPAKTIHMHEVREIASKIAVPEQLKTVAHNAAKDSKYQAAWFMNQRYFHPDPVFLKYRHEIFKALDVHLKLRGSMIDGFRTVVDMHHFTNTHPYLLWYPFGEKFYKIPDAEVKFGTFTGITLVSDLLLYHTKSLNLDSTIPTVFENFYLSRFFLEDCYPNKMSSFWGTHTPFEFSKMTAEAFFLKTVLQNNVISALKDYPSDSLVFIRASSGSQVDFEIYSSNKVKIGSLSLDFLQIKNYYNCVAKGGF